LAWTNRWRIARGGFQAGAAFALVEAIAHASLKPLARVTLLPFRDRAVVGNNLQADPFPHPLPDLMGLFVGIQARVVSPKPAEQFDGGGHVVISRCAGLPKRRKLGSEAACGAISQLGIVYEEQRMITLQLLGEPSDFLVHGRGQWIGLAGRIQLLALVQVSLSLGCDLGVKLTEPGRAPRLKGRS
jgi:hypothetical protein